jgi:hypothetical protein
MQVGIIASHYFQSEVRRHSRVVVNIPCRAANPVIKDECETSDAVDFKWFVQRFIDLSDESHSKSDPGSCQFYSRTCPARRRLGETNSSIWLVAGGPSVLGPGDRVEGPRIYRGPIMERPQDWNSNSRDPINAIAARLLRDARSEERGLEVECVPIKRPRGPKTGTVARFATLVRATQAKINEPVKDVSVVARRATMLTLCRT